MNNEELAKKMVEDKLHLNKLKRENQIFIDNELSQLKSSINDILSSTTNNWYIYKSIDLDAVTKIINSLDFKLSERSSTKIKVINKTHGLTGKRDTFVILDYTLKFDDRYQFEDKFELPIGSLVHKSKLKKLF